MKDKEIMTLEKALFILRHGSAEGEHKYFEAITIIENEINRQNAEIKKLRYNLEAVLDERADHSEAIKEFAEKSEKAILPQLCVSTLEKKEAYYFCLDVINNLLKEMVGDNNA